MCLPKKYNNGQKLTKQNHIVTFNKLMADKAWAKTRDKIR